MTTTDLEAVNYMLGAIEESPVNDLDNPQLIDAVNAKQTLVMVSREVQAKGWHFNTEENYELLPNADDEIVLPSDAMKVDTVGASASIDVAMRGNRLYNKSDFTFNFTDPLYVELVRLLPWDDLAEPVKQYVMMKATRKFVERQIEGGNPSPAYRQDEKDALEVFEDFVSDTGDYNMLRDSHSVYRVLDRRAKG